MSRRLLIAIAVLGSACARSPLTPAGDVVASATEESMRLTALALPLALVSGPARAVEAKAGPGGSPECQVLLDYDAGERLLHASYVEPALCVPDGEPEEAWRPVWVLTDMVPDHVDMLVTDDPGLKPTAGHKGWYMRPTGPSGGPYMLQARSGHNNGRASALVTIARDGSLTVVLQ
jgi:hypothetical protein